LIGVLPPIVESYTVAVSGTLASSLTDDPEAGALMLVLVVSGAGGLTVTEAGVAVEPLYPKPDVGVNTAPTESDPIARVWLDSEAVPVVSETGLPTLVPLTVNCTVPATAGLTLALSVAVAPDALDADSGPVGPVTVVVVEVSVGAG